MHQASYPRLALSVSFFLSLICFFLLLKNASNLYPLKFLPPLILDPFMLLFTTRHFSIQHICNSLFLRSKTDFTDTIVPILKSGEPMMSSNYRTIVIGHYLAKLYGLILESELSIWAEWNACCSAGHASFRKGFTTLDHIFTLRALIEEGRAHNKRIYCCFVDFKKPLTLCHVLGLCSG